MNNSKSKQERLKAFVAHEAFFAKAKIDLLALYKKRAKINKKIGEIYDCLIAEGFNDIRLYNLTQELERHAKTKKNDPR